MREWKVLLQAQCLALNRVWTVKYKTKIGYLISTQLSCNWVVLLLRCFFFLQLNYWVVLLSLEILDIFLRIPALLQNSGCFFPQCYLGCTSARYSDWMGGVYICGGCSLFRGASAWDGSRSIKLLVPPSYLAWNAVSKHDGLELYWDGLLTIHLIVC